MGARRWLTATSIFVVVALSSASVGCAFLQMDPGLRPSGQDPAAVAQVYGQSLVANHNATHLGSDWRFVRVVETSLTPGVEPPPGYVERDFDVLAVRGTAPLSDAWEVASVGLVRPQDGDLWRYKWSTEPDPW